MNPSPEVQIVDVDYARFEGAASLNSRIARERPLLRATLDILWDPADPLSALGRIETALVAFSPSFQRHECRGPADYHVFVKDRRSAREGSPPFDVRLALAHLIEHAVIDFESAITHARRISGLTGAHRDPPGRFDILIECPDPAVGRLCVALAVRALTGAADARPPGRDEHHLLAAARLAYHHPGRVWTPIEVARAFDWTCGRAAAALDALGELGYLRSVPLSMNFSGLPLYEVAGS